MKDKDILLKRIANHLILHSSNLEDVGLFHGKMGIVLFFAHYARYTNMTAYDDFADELLDEVANNISNTLPINMESGLCGIGWGIEYLIQNGFMNGDSNEILANIDKKIMERDLRRVKDLSLETGLIGISYYIKSRIKKLPFNKENDSFDYTYLSEWESIAKELNIYNSLNILSIIKKETVYKDSTILNLGLSDGCTGYGLKIIIQ